MGSVSSKELQIDLFKSGQEKACADLVGRVELFQKYGMTLEKALSLFKSAATDPRNRIWVAEQDSKVVGFAWVVLKGGFARSAYLRLIAVDQEVQGQKLGEALMERVELEVLKPHGLVILASSTNTGAAKFYERLGYRKVGEIPNYVVSGMNEAIYFKGA